MQEIVRSTRGLKSRRLKGKARLNRKITLCLASIICCLSFVAVGVLASLTDVSISIDNDAYYYATAFNKNANDEFIIRTYDDLVAMSNLVNSNTLVPDTNIYYKEAKFYLANDIDPVAEAIAHGVSETEAKNREYLLSPIGKNSETAFSGTFRGDGHTISNVLIVNDSDGSYLGLFGYTAGATITGVGLGTPENPRTQDDEYWRGACIYDSFVDTANHFAFGTLVGYATGKYDANGNLLRKTIISECYSYVDLYVFDPEDALYSGMLVGSAYGGTDISNCYTTGTFAWDPVVKFGGGHIIGSTGTDWSDTQVEKNLDTINNCYSIVSDSFPFVLGREGWGTLEGTNDDNITFPSSDISASALYFYDCNGNLFTYVSENVPIVEYVGVSEYHTFAFTNITDYGNMSGSDALTAPNKMPNLNTGLGLNEDGTGKWTACANSASKYYFPQLTIFLEQKSDEDLKNPDKCFYSLKTEVKLDIHNFIYDPYDSFDTTLNMGKYLLGSKGGNLTRVEHTGVNKGDREGKHDLLWTVLTDSSAADSILEYYKSEAINSGFYFNKQIDSKNENNKTSFIIDSTFTVSATSTSSFDFKGFLLIKATAPIDSISNAKFSLKETTAEDGTVSYTIYLTKGDGIPTEFSDCLFIPYDNDRVGTFVHPEDLSTYGYTEYWLNNIYIPQKNNTNKGVFIWRDDPDKTEYSALCSLFSPKEIEDLTYFDTNEDWHADCEDLSEIGLPIRFLSNSVGLYGPDGDLTSNPKNGDVITKNCAPALMQTYGGSVCWPYYTQTDYAMICGSQGATYDCRFFSIVPLESFQLQFYNLNSDDMLGSSLTKYYISDYEGSNDDAGGYHYMQIVVPNISYDGTTISGSGDTYSGNACIFNGFYDNYRQSSRRDSVYPISVNKVIPDKYVYQYDSKYMVTIGENGDETTTVQAYYINVLFNKDGYFNILDKDGNILTYRQIYNELGYIPMNCTTKTLEELTALGIDADSPFVVKRLVSQYKPNTTEMNITTQYVDNDGNVLWEDVDDNNGNVTFSTITIPSECFNSYGRADYGSYSHSIHTFCQCLEADYKKRLDNWWESYHTRVAKGIVLKGSAGYLIAAENYGYTFVGFYDSDGNKLEDEIWQEESVTYGNSGLNVTFAKARYTIDTDADSVTYYVRYKLHTDDVSISVGVGQENNDDSLNIVQDGVTSTNYGYFDVIRISYVPKYDYLSNVKDLQYGIDKKAIIGDEKYYGWHYSDGRSDYESTEVKSLADLVTLNYSVLSYSSIYFTLSAKDGFKFDGFYAKTKDGTYKRIELQTVSVRHDNDSDSPYYDYYVLAIDKNGIVYNYKDANGNTLMGHIGTDENPVAPELIIKFTPDNPEINAGIGHESLVDGKFNYSDANSGIGYLDISGSLANEMGDFTDFNSTLLIASSEKGIVKAGGNKIRVVNSLGNAFLGETFRFTITAYPIPASDGTNSSSLTGWKFLGFYGIPSSATETDLLTSDGSMVASAVKITAFTVIDGKYQLKCLNNGGKIVVLSTSSDENIVGTYHYIYAMFERDTIQKDDLIHTTVNGVENIEGEESNGGIASGTFAGYTNSSGTLSKDTNSTIKSTDILDEATSKATSYAPVDGVKVKHQSWVKVWISSTLPGYRFVGYTTNANNLSTPQVNATDLVEDTDLNGAGLGTGFNIYVELAVNTVQPSLITRNANGYIQPVKINRVGVAVQSATATSITVYDPDNNGSIYIEVLEINVRDGIYAMFERVPIADAIHGLNGMGISLENGTLSDGTNDASTDEFHTANEPVLNEGLTSGADPMGEVQLSYVSSRRLTTTDAEGNILTGTTYTTFNNQNNNCNHISLNGDINDLFIINIFPYYGFKIKDIYLKTSSGWLQLDAESNTIKVTDGVVTPENQDVALYDYYYRLAINRTETTQTETAVANTGAFTEGATEFSFTTAGETTNYSAIIVTFEPEDYNISYASNSKDIYGRELICFDTVSDGLKKDEEAVLWKYPVDGTATYGDKPSGESALKSTHSYAYNEKYQKTGFSTYAELFKNNYGQNCSDATSNYYIQNNESNGVYEVPGYVFLGWGMYTSDGYLSLAITTDYYLYKVEGATAESVANTYATILAKLNNITYFTHSSSTEVGLTLNANIQDNNGNYQNLSRLLYGYRDADNTTKLMALWVPESGNTEHDTYLVLHGFGTTKAGDNNYLNLNTYTNYGEGSSIGYDLSIPLKSEIFLKFSAESFELNLYDRFFPKTYDKHIDYSLIANSDSACFLGFNNWLSRENNETTIVHYDAGPESGFPSYLDGDGSYYNEVIRLGNINITRDSKGKIPHINRKKLEDGSYTSVSYLYLNIYAEPDDADTENPFCTIESITDENGTTNTYRFIHLYAVWQRRVDIYQGNVDKNGNLSDMEESDDDTETTASTTPMGIKIDTLTKNIAFTNDKLTSQTVFSFTLPDHLIQVQGYTFAGFADQDFANRLLTLELDAESGKYKVNYAGTQTAPTLITTIKLTQKTQNAFAIYSKELTLYYSNSLTAGGDAYQIKTVTNTYYYYIVKQNGIAIEKYLYQDPLAYPHSDGETYEIGWHLGGVYNYAGDTNLTFVGYTSSGFITPETSTPANFYPYVEIVAGSGNYAFTEGSLLPLTKTSQTYYAVYKGASTVYANFSETKQGDTLLFPLESYYPNYSTILEFSESGGMKEFFTNKIYADYRYPFTATQLYASINGVLVNNTDIYFCAFQENGNSGLDPYKIQACTMYTSFGAGSGNKTNANHPEFAYYTIAGWTDYAGLSRVWNTTTGTATNWYNTLDYGTTDTNGNTINRSYYVKYNGNAYAAVADGGDDTYDAYGVSRFVSILPGKSVDLYPVFKHIEASAGGSTDPSGAEVVNPIMLDEEASKVFEIIDFKYNYLGPAEPIRFRPTYDKSTTMFTVATSYYWLGYGGVKLTIQNTSNVKQYIYIHRYQPLVTSGNITSSMFSVTANYSGDLTFVSTNTYSLEPGKTGTLEVGIMCSENPDSKTGDFSWTFGLKYSSSSNVSVTSPNIFQKSRDVFYDETYTLEGSVVDYSSNSYTLDTTVNKINLSMDKTANYIVVKFTNNKYPEGANFGYLLVGDYVNCTYAWSETNSFSSLSQASMLVYSDVVAYGKSIYLKINVATVASGKILNISLLGRKGGNTEVTYLNFAYNGITLGETKVNAKGQEYIFDYIKVIAGYTQRANEYSATAKIDNIYNKLTYFNSASTKVTNYYPESNVALMGDFFQFSASDDFPGSVYIKLNYEATKEFIHITFDKNGGTSFIGTSPTGDTTTTEQRYTQILRYGYILGESAPNGLVYKTQNVTSGVTEYITATKFHAIFLGWYTSPTGGQKILDKDGKFNTQDGCVSVDGYITEDGGWSANSMILYAHFSDTVYAVMVCNNFEGSVPDGVSNEYEYSSLTCNNHSSFVKSATLPYLDETYNLVSYSNGYYKDVNYDGNKTDGKWHISETSTSGVYKYVPFNSDKSDILNHYIIWYVAEGQTGTSGREGFYLKLCGATDSAFGWIEGNCDIKIKGLAIPTVRDTDKGDYTADANDSDSTLAKFRRGNSWKMTCFSITCYRVNCSITGEISNVCNSLNDASNSNMASITLPSKNYITDPTSTCIITANYTRLYTKITLDANSRGQVTGYGGGTFQNEKTKTVYTYYGATGVYKEGSGNNQYMCLTGEKISATEFARDYHPTKDNEYYIIDYGYTFKSWEYYTTEGTSVLAGNDDTISAGSFFKSSYYTTADGIWKYYDKTTSSILLLSTYTTNYTDRIPVLFRLDEGINKVLIKAFLTNDSGTEEQLTIADILFSEYNAKTGQINLESCTFKFKKVNKKTLVNLDVGNCGKNELNRTIASYTGKSGKISSGCYYSCSFKNVNDTIATFYIFQFSEDPITGTTTSDGYVPDTYILLSLPKGYKYSIAYISEDVKLDDFSVTPNGINFEYFNSIPSSPDPKVIDNAEKPSVSDSNPGTYNLKYNASAKLLYLATKTAKDMYKVISYNASDEIQAKYFTLYEAVQDANSNKNITKFKIVDDLVETSPVTIPSNVTRIESFDNNAKTIKYNNLVSENYAITITKGNTLSISKCYIESNARGIKVSGSIDGEGYVTRSSLIMTDSQITTNGQIAIYASRADLNLTATTINLSSSAVGPTSISYLVECENVSNRTLSFKGVKISADKDKLGCLNVFSSISKVTIKITEECDFSSSQIAINCLASCDLTISDATLMSKKSHALYTHLPSESVIDIKKSILKTKESVSIVDIIGAKSECKISECTVESEFQSEEVWGVSGTCSFIVYGEVVFKNCKYGFNAGKSSNNLTINDIDYIKNLNGYDVYLTHSNTYLNVDNWKNWDEHGSLLFYLAPIYGDEVTVYMTKVMDTGMFDVLSTHIFCDDEYSLVETKLGYDHFYIAKRHNYYVKLDRDKTGASESGLFGTDWFVDDDLRGTVKYTLSRSDGEAVEISNEFDKMYKYEVIFNVEFYNNGYVLQRIVCFYSENGNLGKRDVAKKAGLNYNPKTDRITLIYKGRAFQEAVIKHDLVPYNEYFEQLIINVAGYNQITFNIKNREIFINKNSEEKTYKDENKVTLSIRDGDKIYLWWDK